MMNKAIIETLSHEGRGITHVNGKTVFIDNALPGEEVLFTYLKQHKKFAEGIAIEILNPAEHRVPAACPHYALCGGCSLQHISAEQQILQKQQVLLEQLQHFAGAKPVSVLPPLTGPQYNYRRKARLGVKYLEKKQRLLIGFHEKNGRYLADIDSCITLDPRIGLLLSSLKILLSQIPGSKTIPQLEVALGDGDAALIIRHLAPLAHNAQSALIEFAQQHNFHLYLQPGKPSSTYRIWPIAGKERLSYHLTLQDIKLNFHPHDFIQVNPELNGKMVTLTLQLLELSAQDTVLDLFCGIGNFSLPMARLCHHVTAIEGESNMVERGRENAELNGIHNISFYNANLAAKLSPTAWSMLSYSKILLDPPRCGAAEIIKCFSHFKAKRIVYLSCNPATLARDTGILLQQGYRLSKVGVLDMFPQTRHVESIAVFDY